MGLPVARVKDMTSGHQCYPPVEIESGSPNVYANGMQVARVGDRTKKHQCLPMEDPHGSEIIGKGSKKVFVNNKPAARITDKCSCPQVIMTGSTDVFFG